MMQKECPICGVYFETDNKLRKYCDKCKDNVRTKQRQLNRAYRESKNRMYEPEVLDLICDRCGKEFKTIKKLLFYVSERDSHDGEKHIFCSQKCKQQYKDDFLPSKCRFCGKTLDKVYLWSEQFCSEDCRKKTKRKIAEDNGWVHTCYLCGKEFIRRDGGTFCSKECYRNAVKGGWRPEKPMEESKTLTRVEHCLGCGKTRQKTYNLPSAKIPRYPVYVCSGKCRDIAQKKLDALQKQRHEREEEKTETKQQNADNYEQLCISCKTPYSDCERMQSNFRILPKGAKYNGKGILTVCPKYKT